MTTDPFTEAARAEAERVARENAPLEYDSIREAFVDAYAAGLQACTHLAAQEDDGHDGWCGCGCQEPTDAEVLAALNAQGVAVSPKMRPAPSLDYWGDKPAEAMRAALSAARDTRRDEEKR